MPILGARGGASSRGLGQFQGNPTAPTSPVAGYHLWLDAANAGSFTYSSGTVVSQWTDRSANAFTFTTAATSNQPSRNGTQNSKSTVVFDGYDDYLKSTAAASTWKYLHDGTGATIFVVAKSKETEPGTSGNNYILDTSNTDVGFGLAIEGGTTPNRIRFELFEDTTFGSLLFTRRNIPTSEHNLYVAYLDPNNATSSKKLPAYINGGTEQAPNVVVDWPGGSSSNPGSTLFLGTGYNGLFAGTEYSQYMLNGEIAEIITYQSVLSDSDRIANINYLRAKWGI
jgi:hypothetical protein